MKSLHILFVSCLAFINACTLNSSQEASLNQHTSKFLEAKNNCMLVGVVGFTYPEYIQELKIQGDSALMKELDCNAREIDHIFLSNPTVRKTKSKENFIHVLYDFTATSLDENSDMKTVQYVAISKDRGQKWYYLPLKKYQDKENCKTLKRLF